MNLKMPFINGREELCRHQQALHPESFSVDLNVQPSGHQISSMHHKSNHNKIKSDLRSGSVPTLKNFVTSVCVFSKKIGLAAVADFRTSLRV